MFFFSHSGRICSFSLDISMGVLERRLPLPSLVDPPLPVSPPLEDVIMQQSDTCPCAP